MADRLMQRTSPRYQTGGEQSICPFVRGHDLEFTISELSLRHDASGICNSDGMMNP